MSLTLMPQSKNSLLILVAALVASLVLVATMGGRRKPRGAPSPAPATAGLVALPGAGGGTDALPGGLPAVSGGSLSTPAGAPPGAGATVADTTFGESPFLSLVEEAPAPGAPPAGDAGLAAALAAAGIPTRPSVTLQGTVVTGGHASALISGRYYSVGDDVDGWRVTWIGPREVRLVRDGETLTLRMERE